MSDQRKWSVLRRSAVWSNLQFICDVLDLFFERSMIDIDDSLSLIYLVGCYVAFQVLERALQECGNDIDAAIKRLNELCLGTADRNGIAEELEVVINLDAGMVG